MKLITLVLGMVVIAVAGVGAAQETTIFQTDLPPGEGPHVFVAMMKILRLRSAPSTASPVVKTVTVSIDESLSYDAVRYRTMAAGVLRVISPARVEGRMIGPVTQLFSKEYHSGNFSTVKIDVARGTTVDYLQYRAEGTCFVRVDKNVINASPCPDINKNAFKLEKEEETELWIHLTVESGGWLMVDEKTVKRAPQ
jgi:hypothetical protein